MNTLEIDHVLKTHPSTRNVFKGVYASNRLPRRLNVPSASIGNTDPDDRPGTHWVALYIDVIDGSCKGFCEMNLHSQVALFYQLKGSNFRHVGCVRKQWLHPKLYGTLHQYRKKSIKPKEISFREKIHVAGGYRVHFYFYSSDGVFTAGLFQCFHVTHSNGGTQMYLSHIQRHFLDLYFIIGRVCHESKSVPTSSQFNFQIHGYPPAT
jgi:hypothetical protein